MEPISEKTKLELVKLAAAEAHLENYRDRVAWFFDDTMKLGDDVYRVHARWDIGKLTAEQIDAELDGDKLTGDILAEATDWTAPRDVRIWLAGGAA